MSAKIHWNLLILFGVFCQGIISTSTEENIDKSSELLVRQKRVINTTPGEDITELIRNSPYVVSVKVRFTRDDSCVGVIMTRNIVLTAAKCVEVDMSRLKVYSGSAQAILPRLSNSRIHNVTNKRVFVGNHPMRPDDGIAMVTVAPAFVYSLNTEKIDLYEGPVHAGLQGIISGWGCHRSGHPGTAHPGYLRAIHVPIISNEDCIILYLHTLPITESDICTLDAFGHQYCGATDVGAPLAFEINLRRYLVGIHLWNGAVVGRSNPDVFVNLQNPRYKNWIRETIPILEAAAH